MMPCWDANCCAPALDMKFSWVQVSPENWLSRGLGWQIDCKSHITVTALGWMAIDFKRAAKGFGLAQWI